MLGVALVVPVSGWAGPAADASPVSPASTAPVVTADRAGLPAAGAAVLDVVMLVDESGSETPAKVAAERQTAGTIVQTMLNPASRVTVVGFGGVNDVVPDQSPVDVVCQPTLAGGANLDYLASCVNNLHRRTEAEGNDTDYAAALGQAMSYFNPATKFGSESPAGAIKVILMMTDGGVDVSRDTQQYGINWRLGEQQAVSQQLALARQYGTQVWPLGFGTVITPRDASYLNQLARGGARTACDIRPASEPHYLMVNSPADVLNALDELYAAAGCLGTSTTSPVEVGGAQEATLRLMIPSIASVAAISVDRGDPAVQVSYYTPDGQPWADASVISGQGSPVQVLHLPEVTRAETGIWTIKLKAAPGLAAHAVRATVFWQGAVRALLTADPPDARPGEPIDVTLSVLGPGGPVADPSTLSRLQVRISVSGDGLSGAKPLRVTGAGEYRSRFTAPPQAGTLTFTGTAAGYGLYATNIPATVRVAGDAAAFIAAVHPPPVSTVRAGHAIHGEVDFVNRTGAARGVRLKLKVSHALARVTRSAGLLTARPDSSSGVPFTISFGAGSPPGLAWLEVEAVDAVNPHLIYSIIQLYVSVIGPQGIVARWKPQILGSLGGVAVIVAVWFGLRLAYRRRADVRGLIAVLRLDGAELGPVHRIPSDKWARQHRFRICDEGKPTAQLAKAKMGLPAYTVSRIGGRQVKLITPHEEVYDINLGKRGRVLDHNGLELSFTDIPGKRLKLPPAPARARWRRRSPAVSSLPTPSGDEETNVTIKPPPKHDDDWL